MTPDDPRPGAIRPEGGTAFDQFGREARMEARMLDPDKDVTPEQRQTLIRELQSYRESHTTHHGRPLPWAELGSKIGVSGSSLLEITQGKYKASPDGVLRKVDQFLADENTRVGRFDARTFARIELTEKIKGAIDQGLKHNTIPVIIGEPGSGKSAHARWFVGQRTGAVLIEPDDLDCDERWVVEATYKALGFFGAKHRFNRQKKRAVVDYLRRHKNAVIVVDEAQKLTRGALEMLRRLHDLSDPQGLRNVSIVLFGDEEFYKLIIRSRDGSRTPISPQITRRIYPLFDIKTHGCNLDKDGNPIAGTVYTPGDVEAITRNRRIRVVKGRRELGWLTKLANTHGYGALGMAMRVFEVSWDLRTTKVVTIEDLVLALETVLGPEDVQLVDEQAGHELLAARMAG